MPNDCQSCDGRAKWPISDEERAALVSLPKTLPLNNNCTDCDVTGSEAVRIRREKEGKNAK
jgi:hypothetical protein